MSTFFARNCEVLRKSKNWKQSEIEGFSVSTWSNYENGRSVPGFDDLIKISRLFEVSIDELLFTDLSKNTQVKLKGTKKYSVDHQEKFSLVEDDGDTSEKTKTLYQRVKGLENRLDKLEKLIKKITDRL